VLRKQAAHHPKNLIVAESRVSISENTSASGAPAPEGTKLRWQAAVRALRHRNFQLFFSGQLISLIGTWMQTVAQPDSRISVCTAGWHRRRSQ
jgi:hypothetical protein